MSNFQIHELSTGALDRDSNLVHDTEVSTDVWNTRKATAGAVADLASANVAAPYDDTITYAIGQYCSYEGDIYRCIAITTGAFDSTAWVQIVVTGEFRRVVELTSAQYTALSSAEKNNGTLYIITDEETTAADIPYSAGVSVADMLSDLNNVLTPIGITQSAAWTASSASAFDTPLTGSITLDKGIYLITIATPVMNNTETLQLSANSGSITKYSTSYPNIPTQSNNTFVIAVTSATSNVQVKTGGSIANSYSYLERGGLFVTRIK